MRCKIFATFVRLSTIFTETIMSQQDIQDINENEEADGTSGAVTAPDDGNEPNPVVDDTEVVDDEPSEEEELSEEEEPSDNEEEEETAAPRRRRWWLSEQFFLVLFIIACLGAIYYIKTNGGIHIGGTADSTTVDVAEEEVIFPAPESVQAYDIDSTEMPQITLPPKPTAKNNSKQASDSTSATDDAPDKPAAEHETPAAPEPLREIVPAPDDNQATNNIYPSINY